MTISGQRSIIEVGLSMDRVQSEMNRMSRELLWTSDEVPMVMNPRNLTDRRGRTGLLLEYSLPHLMNRLLGSSRSGYVTSNQFGDFYVGADGMTLWIEAKSLDLDAEEYAANLATPLAWIPPTGLLMVMVYQNQKEGLISYPRVLDIGVFSAKAIAKCRDYGWLEPTTKQILLDGASYLTDNGWKREEGNLGKLGRIGRSVDSGSIATPFFSETEQEEIEAFREFLFRFDQRRAEVFATRVARVAEFGGITTEKGYHGGTFTYWVLCKGEIRNLAVVTRHSDLEGSRPSFAKIQREVPGDAEMWIIINPKFGYSIYEETRKIDGGRKINLLPDDELSQLIDKQLK